MITDWNEFENWREQSIIYHKKTSEFGYLNALTYFEHAREYFNKNGFPDKQTRGKPTKTNPLGNFRNWTLKESQKQKEDINEFIKKKSFKKVQKRRSRRKIV